MKRIRTNKDVSPSPQATRSGRRTACTCRTVACTHHAGGTALEDRPAGWRRPRLQAWAAVAARL